MLSIGSAGRTSLPGGALLLFALIISIASAALHTHVGSSLASAAAPPAADIVYCVNADAQPAADYSTGGLQIANSQGMPLFLIPASIIAEVPATPAVDTLIASGPGSFGVIELYRLANGQFELSGADPHDRYRVRVWYECALPPT